MGSLVVVLLSLSALFVAGSLARRFRLVGAELALGITLFFHVVVLFPIHVLGVTGHLGRVELAVAAAGFQSLLFVGVARGRVFIEAQATAAAFTALTRRARGALSEIKSGGLVPLSALAIGGFALGFALWLTYLLPSDAWDSLWYHDLMVGYAIQNHGYAVVDLPAEGLPALIQQANAFPRNSEMMSLWFAIFGSSRWLELPNTLAVLPLAIGAYASFRSFAGASRADAALWSVALVLMPGVRLQMRTSYVDIHFAALVVCTSYFCVQRGLDPLRPYLAAIGCALVLGTKSNALLIVPTLAATTLLFIVLRRGLRAGLAWAAFAVALFAAAGFTYWLNWRRFGSPFYPFDMPLPFGLHAKGPVDAAVLDARDREDVLRTLFTAHTYGQDWPDPSTHGFGPAAGFIALPAATVGLAVLVVDFVFALVRRVRGLRDDSSFWATVTFVATTACGIVAWRKSTAPWSSRYHIAFALVAMVLGLRAVVRLSRPKAKLGAVLGSVLLVGNVMAWVWCAPGWGVDGPKLRALLRANSVDRVAESPMPTLELARGRQKLGPGELVVWSDECLFASLAWREDYANRLQYLPETGEAFVTRARALDATWMLVSKDASAYRFAAADPDYEELGIVDRHPQTKIAIFARRRR